MQKLPCVNGHDRAYNACLLKAYNIIDIIIDNDNVTRDPSLTGVPGC